MARDKKRQVKRCVEKLKRSHRRHLAALAMSKDPQMRKLALQQLAGGNSIGTTQHKPRQAVPPERFKEHFEKLFSKASEQETFGLTEEKVGRPKAEPLDALSGPPSLSEIQLAISRPQDNKAPGANGLPSEVFKAGGAPLAHKLHRDFKAIWPAVGADGITNDAKVFQSWQDAEVVTLFKNKGSRSDPSNYRGIFLLDVAGKIFASVIERRIRQAAEAWLSDSQNGFREKRSTSHAIHTLRRLQDACRIADMKAFVAFVDFEKAFDSPPRAAIYECLAWIGIPQDLLAVVRAIHESPKGKVSGSKVWFQVARGIRQGCTLGPLLFNILLEFAKRLAGLNTNTGGIKLSCARRKQMDVPPELVGQTFCVGSVEFADDMAVVETAATRLSEALDKLQAVTGAIGLNLSVAKTEWMYLHNPDSEELGACQSRRSPAANCCEQVLLNGKPLKHVSCFRYLGSILSENGGTLEDTRFRVMQAELALNKHNAIWKSDLTLRFKIRHLQTRVFPSLLYATECGNHTQKDLDAIGTFLNKCRRRVLNVGRREADGTVIKNSELHKKCVLPEPLDLLSRRRLTFAAKLLLWSPSTVAKQMIWANVSMTGTRRVGGRERSSYLNVLVQDLKYLYSGELPQVPSLAEYCHLMQAVGPLHIQRVLKELKPNTARGSSLRLVNERPKTHPCTHTGCIAKFAEQKEVNRHIRRVHAGQGRADARGGDPDKPFACLEPGCSARFKTGGWLARHQKSNHGVAVPNTPRASPQPSAGVGPVQVQTLPGSLVGRAPHLRGDGGSTENPVSLPGDGQSGPGSRRSQRLRGQAAEE